MKKTFLILSLSISAIIALTSCEGNTRRTFKIENQGSQSIDVYFTDFSGDSTAITVVPNSTGIVQTYDMLGGNSDSGQPGELSYITDIYQGSDTCKKDRNTKQNWLIISTHERKAPSQWDHQYTFTVDDQDF